MRRTACLFALALFAPAPANARTDYLCYVNSVLPIGRSAVRVEFNYRRQVNVRRSGQSDEDESQTVWIGPYRPLTLRPGDRVWIFHPHNRCELTVEKRDGRRGLHVSISEDQYIWANEIPRPDTSSESFIPADPRR